MERSTENEGANHIQESAREAYVTQIQRIAVSLGRYEADGRAVDAGRMLMAAIDVLNDGYYVSEAYAPEGVEGSPGVDDEGNPLPPFAPMELPEA